MTKLSKEDLVRLAEFCGYQVDDSLSITRDKDGSKIMFHSPWQPDEDIKQAMECLEAIDSTYTIKKIEDDQYLVDVWLADESIIGKRLELTICKAVLKAMEEG